MNKYMEEALQEAKKAAAMGEIPVGAVIVKDGQIIARGHNRTETDRDPTAHAEMIAIRSRIERLVIGTMDPKGGACGSVFNIVQEPRLNHHVDIETGCMQEACADLMKGFFRDLRNQKRINKPEEGQE